MNFNQFFEITGYFIFFIIILYVTFVLVQHGRIKEEKTEEEKIQFNRSILFLFLGLISGFLLSIAALIVFDPDGKISSEIEFWYLTIFVSTVIIGVAGFAISKKKQ